MLFLIIIVPVLVSNFIISNINYKYYNLRIVNDFTNGSYADTYKLILNIESNNNIDRVTHSFSELKMIGKYSPSFNEVLKFFDNRVEIPDGTLFWYLRRKAHTLHNFQDAKEDSEFWLKVKSEIETAVDNGYLKYRFFKTPSLLISPINKNHIYNFHKKYITDYLNFIGYTDLEVGNELSTNNRIKLEEFENIVHQNTLNSINPNFVQNNVGEITILKVVTGFYKIFIPLITIINLFYLRKFIISKNNNVKILVLVIFIFVCVSLAGISYTSLSSFDASSYYYMAPFYNLWIILNSLIFYQIYKKK